MIDFDLSGGHFTYRVAGVCLHDGCVLTHKNQAEDFYALPGGRVEILEFSEAALCREMREELGVDIRIERLLWVIENVFTYEGRSCHELGLYYLMSLDLRSRDDAPGIYDTSRSMRCLDEPDLTLQWLTLADLSSFKLLPTPLSHRLTELPASPQHIMHEDHTSSAGQVS